MPATAAAFLGLLGLLLAAPGADALSVHVRVRDIDGSIIKEVASGELLEGAGADAGGAVTGATAMRKLATSGELSWGFVKMGGKDVVTELEGLRARIPLAAWILTHVSRARDFRAVNVGMGDVVVHDGDELDWQLTPLEKNPAPTVLPYAGGVAKVVGEEEEEGEGEDEEDEEDEL